MLGIRISVILFLLSAQASVALTPSISYIKAIEDKDWGIALREAGNHNGLRSYATWRMLQDSQQDVSFAQLNHFMAHHPDWPSLNRISMRAERALFDEPILRTEAKAWLRRHPPISGYGMLALARATGTKDRKLIRQAWVQGDFSKHDEDLILAEFHSFFDETLHRQRTERLLRERKTRAAERMLDLLDDAHHQLFAARIAIIENKRGLNGYINRIPQALRKDDGLLADRLLWRHKKGLADGVRELLLQMQPHSAYADMLWRIRASHIRDAIEAYDYDEAQRLLKNAGTQLSGAKLADMLWMKGWLEFTFLNKPDQAYETFYQLFHNVGYPISRARGAYWSAQAAKRHGNAKIAHDWLLIAAQYPTTFYGQLAQSQLEAGKPLLLPREPATDPKAVRYYEQHVLTQLAKALHDANQPSLALALIHHLAQDARTAGAYKALLKWCEKNGLRHAQIRVAKEALKQNIILRDGWPKIATPSDLSIDPMLAHAIARQESEFNPKAVSRANARGLMQLLPSTARKTANKLDLPYELSQLFEPNYNMRLGSKYLGDLIDGFDGSYILAIAGYNAGPGRSRQWTDRFGHPGASLEKTITWLEMIPFSETRNYVQRVLENVQMYRALQSPSTPLSIEQDLLR